MKQQAQARAPRVAPAAILPAAQTRHIPIKKILSVAVLAVIVVLAGLLAYHHDQRQQAAERAFAADKARFSRLEADMTTLAQTIKRETSFDSSLTKSCGHRSAKLDDGKTFCVVSTSIPGINEDDVKIGRIVDMNGPFSVDRTVVQNRYSSSVIALKYNDGFNCEARIYRDDEKSSTSYVQCSSLVTKPVYTLVE